jgi:hypothetical protein
MHTVFRLEDNITNDLREKSLKGVDWMHLARALMNTVMNLQVPLKAGNFLTS